MGSNYYSDHLCIWFHVYFPDCSISYYHNIVSSCKHMIKNILSLKHMIFHIDHIMIYLSPWNLKVEIKPFIKFGPTMYPYPSNAKKIVDLKQLECINEINTIRMIPICVLIVLSDPINKYWHRSGHCLGIPTIIRVPVDQ